MLLPFHAQTGQQRAAIAKESVDSARVSTDQWMRDKVEPKDFYKHLNDLCQQLTKRQEQQWIGHYTKFLVNCLFYMGKQTLIRGTRGTVGIVQVNEDTDPVYVNNKIRVYQDNVTSMCKDSSPEILFAAPTDDDQGRRRRLGALRTLNTKYNHDHFSDNFKQEVWDHAQWCGPYHAEVWFDPNISNGKEWYEEYGPHIVPGAAYAECQDCGYEEPYTNQAKVCRQCSSLDVKVSYEEQREEQTLIGSGWKTVGDVRVDFFPAYQMRYALTCGPSLSPWRYCEQDVPIESVEALFGKLPAGARANEWADDEVLHPARIMRRAEAARRGGSTGTVDDYDSALLQRFFLEPEMLHFFSSDKPITLPNGEQIPAGERLSEVFPEGICLTTVPGTPTFLNVTRESHRVRFVDGVFGNNPGSHIGYGIEDARIAQHQYNVAHSIDFTYLRRTAMPALVGLQNVFKDGNIYNRPDNVIRVNPKDLGEYKRVSDAFAFLKAPEPSWKIEAMTNRLEGNMQQFLKSLVGSSAGPSQFSETATGDRLEADKQNVLLSNALGRYGEWIKEISIKRLLLAQEHFQDTRLINVFNERTAEWDARELLKADIEGEFEAWVKPGSALPTLPEQKMTRMKLALEALTIIKTNDMDTPAMRRKLDEYFGVDISGERQTEHEDVCQEDLNTLLELAPQTDEIDPMAGEAMARELTMAVKVSPFEAGNEIKINWWREWLASPAGRKSSDVIRRAVELIILRLKGAADLERAAVAESAAVGAGAIPPPLAIQSLGVPNMEPTGGPSPAPALPEGNALAAAPASQRQKIEGGVETQPALPALVQGVTK